MISQSVQTITPEIARTILERQTVNRPLNKATINRYARAMKAGRWRVGPPLMFNGSADWEGLIDGQHRMEAVRRSGVSIEFLVLSGIDKEVFQHIDVGKGRNTTDLLSMMGCKNPVVCGTIARVVSNMENGANYPAAGARELLPAEIAERALNDTLIQEVGNEIYSQYKPARLLLRSTALCGWLLYTLRKEVSDQELVDDFFSTLSGLQTTDDSNDPAFVLRNRLTDDALAKRKLSYRDRSAIAIKAWNAYIGGTPIKNLKFNSFGKHREKFPTLRTDR